MPVRQAGCFEVPLLFSICIESFLKILDVMQQDIIAYFTRLEWGNYSPGLERRKGRGEKMPSWLKKLNSCRKKTS